MTLGPVICVRSSDGFLEGTCIALDKCLIQQRTVSFSGFLCTPSQFIPVLSPKDSDGPLSSLILKHHQFTETLHCCDVIRTFSLKKTFQIYFKNISE